MIGPISTRDSSLSLRMTFLGCFWGVFCHSERAFGRGRIPRVIWQVEVIGMFAMFNYDWSNQYAGFFAIAQNDISGVFFVILNELLGEEESQG